MEAISKEGFVAGNGIQDQIRAFSSEGSVQFGSYVDGIISIDSEGKIVSLNQAAEVLTGWTSTQLRGKFFKESIEFRNIDTDIPYSALLEETFRESLKLELKMAVRLVGKDGKARPVLCSTVPVLDQSYSEIGRVLVFRRISCLQRLAEERVREQNLASLGRLAGGIAHNFNNALTGILANISLAKIIAPLESDLSNLLKEAEKATFQAQDLTRELLTFAPGGIPIKKKIYLPEVIQKPIESALRGTSIRYDVIMDQDLWRVDIDQQQITQAVQNIVLNAVQAMSGKGQLRIRLENIPGDKTNESVLPDIPCVKLSFSDNGVGISEENLPRIFDPYFTTQPKRGGLGLTIAHSIVTKHGGHIRVSSTKGLGTLVDLFLPVESKTSTPAERQSPDGDQRRGKILVMDDEEFIRNICRTGLKKFGFEVETAADGVSALNAYQLALGQGDPFDLVILDLVVPNGMDGETTLHQLMQINPAVKTILTSGYSEDVLLSTHRKQGFTEALIKPFKIGELVETIESLEKPNQ